MKRSTIDEILARVGISAFADDDPRYREGPAMQSVGNAARPAPSVPEQGGELTCAGEDEDEKENIENCPFCGADTCAHHVASLDLTYRQVVGGGAFDACSSYLARREEELAANNDAEQASDSAFDDLEALLDELPAVVGIRTEYEGGPGQSSVMRHYWVEPPKAMSELASLFSGYE